MKRHIIFFLLLAAMSASCTKNNGVTNPPSSSRQQNIAWPSLAATHWPMHQHDPQQTGRSSLAGPATAPRLLWSLDVPMTSAVALKSDSTLVITSRKALRTYSLDGAFRDSIILEDGGGSIQAAPVVGADGTIYSVSVSGTLFASESNSLLWKYALAGPLNSEGLNIGKDGTLYFVSTLGFPFGTLHAVNGDGTERWKKSEASFNADCNAFPISPDGLTLYIPGTKGSAMLSAVDAEYGTSVWTYGTAGEHTILTPVVDNAGNIYVVGQDKNRFGNSVILASISSSGSERWVYNFERVFEQGFSSPPVIDWDGNITFAYDTIYSLSPQGTLRWKTGFPGEYIDKPLVCDANNTLYACPERSYDNTRVVAIGKQGEVLWSYPLPFLNGPLGDQSVVIAPGNRLVIGSSKGDKVICLVP